MCGSLMPPSMPGLLKIGMSAQDPKIHRVKELSQTTSVPKPFLVEYQILVEDESYAETHLHQLFRNHRLENREFFERLTVSQIVQTARDEFDIKLEEFPSKNADEVELKISQTAEQVEAESRVADAEAEKERRNAWLRRVRHEAREIRSQYYDTVARHKELMLWRKVFTFGLYRGKQFDADQFPAEKLYIMELNEKTEDDIRESFDDREAPLAERFKKLAAMKGIYYDEPTVHPRPKSDFQPP